MSRKSRRPDKPAKGAPPPSRAGRQAAPATAPFEVVVGLALLLAAPTLMAYLSGEMEFDAAAVRTLVALGVAWVLSNLVVLVFKVVRPEPVEPVAGAPAGGIEADPRRSG